MFNLNIFKVTSFQKIQRWKNRLDYITKKQSNAEGGIFYRTLSSDS